MPLAKLFTLKMLKLDSFFSNSATAISFITPPRILLYRNPFYCHTRRDKSLFKTWSEIRNWTKEAAVAKVYKSCLAKFSVT